MRFCAALLSAREADRSTLSAQAASTSALVKQRRADASWTDDQATAQCRGGSATHGQEQAAFEQVRKRVSFRNTECCWHRSRHDDTPPLPPQHAPPNLREYYFTGPRVMVVSSAITSNALMLKVGSPFISAIIGPSMKSCTAASSLNR